MSIACILCFIDSENLNSKTTLFIFPAIFWLLFFEATECNSLPESYFLVEHPFKAFFFTSHCVKDKLEQAIGAINIL